MEKLKPELVLQTKDYFLTGQEFGLYLNPEFGFLETRPCPLENLSEYYKSEDYISHSDSSKKPLDKIYQLIKKQNIAYKFSKLKSEKDKSELLDIGCGTGDFLVYAQKKGMIVSGIEPDSGALILAQKKLENDKVRNIQLREINQKFDFITLWHVLEHLPELDVFVEELKTKLKPGGKIIVALPNHKSYDARFYKKYWAAYDTPRHLWHFSTESFSKFMNAHQLKITKKYPLWFDSFYVSIISEKYKKTKFGILRACIIGGISNLMALFDGNYSSIIYEIEK